MIAIFTYCFNNPKYLLYQYNCFKKFLKDDFELVCINNAKDDNIKNKLIELCLKLNISHHINPTPDHSLAGLSHYSALQWSYNNVIRNYTSKIIITDHDVFLIKSLSIEELSADADIIGISQSRKHINYFHPALLMLNMNRIPDKESISFYGGNIDGINVDIGGELYYYLQKNPQLKIKYLSSFGINSKNINLSLLPEIQEDYDEKYDFEIIQDSFLHTRIGSNWIGMGNEVFANRNNIIYKYLDLILGK